MMAASEETGTEETFPSSNPSLAMSVAMERDCKELWSQFDEVGTEMIVTRRGRYVLGFFFLPIS